MHFDFNVFISFIHSLETSKMNKISQAIKEKISFLFKGCCKRTSENKIMFVCKMTKVMPQKLKSFHFGDIFIPVDSLVLGISMVRFRQK